jgi:folate-dependent phosphoribosylglycinamide formyltransferase PurN
MTDRVDKADRPIRVVVFTSGPMLERGVLQFLDCLEKHPKIELLACIAQSRLRSRRETYAELWQRRGILSAPILLAGWADAIWRFIRAPRKEMDFKRNLKTLADRIHFVPDIHAQAVLNRVRSLQPELGLIYGSPILKPTLFEIPSSGTLGIHHGKVPEYRGKKTMFWAMYNGEQAAGVTIQKVNAGLDTGQIVKEGEVPARHRFPRAVWRDLDKLGIDLYIQAILDVRAGTASYRPQTGQKGRLYRDPSIADVIELWRRILTRMVKDWLGTLTRRVSKS